MSGRTVAGTTPGTPNPVHRVPTIKSVPSLARSGRSRAWHRLPWWRDCLEASVPTLQHPAFFVDHPMMAAAQECQVGQLRGASLDPPDQVMSVAPAQRPVAAREEAMLVAGFQGPPRRRWDGPARMVELVLELAAAGDLRD